MKERDALHINAGDSCVYELNIAALIRVKGVWQKVSAVACTVKGRGSAHSEPFPLHYH